MPNQRRRRSDTTERPTIAEDRANAPVGAPTNDAIRARAHEIYEARGAGHGHDVNDWLQAERELRERTNGTDDEAA